MQKCAIGIIPEGNAQLLKIIILIFQCQWLTLKHSLGGATTLDLWNKVYFEKAPNVSKLPMRQTK